VAEVLVHIKDMQIEMLLLILDQVVEDQMLHKAVMELQEL
jgi:hypothetical protein